MLNYIKCELYRITHSLTFYILGLVCMVLPVLLNLLLYVLSTAVEGFSYGTTSFSYSELVANPMYFCVAALCVVFILYDGNKKNGNLKNAIACGISRKKIFAGQFIVGLAASVVIMIVTEATYIASARLLLVEAGPVKVTDLLNEIWAVAPVAMAALILAVVVNLLFDKSFVGAACWFLIFILIPEIMFYLGTQVDVFYKIAMWLPVNFFGQMVVNMSECTPIWDTAQGVARCWISGFAGIVVFGIWGMIGFGKKEV